MAALAKCLLLSASCAALVGALPVGFPCANATPTVLASVKSTSWPGACLDLKDVSSATTKTEESCKAACIADQTCSVWQLGPSPSKYCYISDEEYTATQCWGRDNDTTYKPLAAERLQHGFINVTQKLTAGSFVPGLMWIDMKSTIVAEGTKRCKGQCYSILACEKWLYVTGTSSVAGTTGQNIGCHLQTKASTLGAMTTLPAGQTSEGEQIQHTCVPPPAPPAKKKDNTLLWTILALIAILVLLIIVALVIFFVCCQKEKKPKKTRAVKVAPKKEVQVLQPLVRMPVVQQPMVQYAAPTVTTTMATPTYQAVPQAAPAVYASAPMVQSVAVAPTVTTRPMLM